MEDGWWYASGEHRNGPLSTEQVLELIRENSIGPQTLIWRPGRMVWKPIGELPEFALQHSDIRSDSQRDGHDDRQDPVFDGALLPATIRTSAPDGTEMPWSRAEPPMRVLPPSKLRSRPLAPPSRRFFAQLLDVWTMCVPIGFLLGIAGRFWPSFGLWMSSPTSSVGFGVLLIPLALIAQAVVFGLFGSTLGKFLLGVQVTLADGNRPTFIQYLGRTVRLYWAGLGLGIPFITLFTMWRQYAMVKHEFPTSYDAGRFQVYSASMGIVRRSLAAFSVVALIVGFGYLQHVDSEAQSKYFAGFEWRNPISNKSVNIPQGWVFTQQINAEGDPIFTFSSHAAGVVTVFAIEEGDEALTLDQYQRMWVTAVRSQMAMDIRANPVTVKGRFGLQMHGVMVNNASRLIHTTMVKNGGQVWRVVSVGMNGKEPESAFTEQLRTVLFETLPDRPPRPERVNPPPPRGSSV